MADVTVNYSFNLPSVGGDDDAWGELLNANWTSVDAVLFGLTNRTLTAGDGLSGGGNLTANRSFSVDSSVVRTSRTLTAGDGLSGGGNLGANRSFAVDSSVVRTSDNQTIGGDKTFTGTIIANAGGLNGQFRVSRTGGTHPAELSITPSGSAIRYNLIEGDQHRFFGGPVEVVEYPLLLGAQATTTSQAVRADRAITAGDGLSGGGNLTANRTVSVDSSVVRTSRSIGTSGIATGGGNLGADRTINVPGTNLGLGGSGNSRTITSSTGSNVSLPTATASNAGLMSTGDKSKLDGVAAGAQVNVGTNLGSSGTGATRTITSSTGSNTSISYSAADVGAVPTGRTLTAGDGLSGGGDLSSNRSFSVDSSVVRTTRTITAGTGLTGGGSLAANRTINLASSERMTTGNVLAQTAGASAAAVGTYIFARRSANGLSGNRGDIEPGSALRPSDAASNSTVGDDLPGTWMLFGRYVSSQASLWLRIS